MPREQYYIDNFELEYNTLKKAGSLYGFKHSAKTKEQMSVTRTGKSHTEESKLKIYANSGSYALKVVNTETKEIMYFSSIRRVAIFLDMHHSYLAKCLNKDGFYEGRNYYITKKTDE